MTWIAYDLEAWQWILLILSALSVGLTKTGLPGLGIVVVPLAAVALPARQSVGVVLPMLIFADLFAAGAYRRHAQWKHLVRLLPSTIAGIAAGYFVLKGISSAQLKPLIGVIVLIMLALKAKTMFGKSAAPALNIDTTPGKAFAFLMGFFAGMTTMMANAAGPVMILYLLAMRLPKEQFMGTSAWFFFIVNWIKVPGYLSLGLITPDSLKLDLTLFPVIAVGACLGIFLLPRIPQRLFNIAALALAAAAAALLIFG